MAGVALLATAAHLIALKEAPKGALPESRRRIRTATGWVIMFAIPLSAYAFGIATPGRAGTFVLVWTAVVGLVGVILMLAMVDAINTMRLHRRASRRLRRDWQRMREGESDDVA
jgi:hypothetical protein